MEPRLIVMPPVQKPKGELSSAEKKMRKQMRDQIVHKKDPNDKKTFLKEIQKELRKLADPTVGPQPLVKTKKNAKKLPKNEEKMGALRQLYDEA